MTRLRLAVCGLRHYWRTHATVVAGVAIATAVLAGALIVGESVRHSLLALSAARLGAAQWLVSATVPFRERLADELAQGQDTIGAVPLLAIEGTVTHDASRRRATRVAVYGVDGRFWQFHGVSGVAGPTGRQAYLSEALAAELGASAGDDVLVTVEAVTDIPAGTLQGTRVDRARVLRATAARTLPAGSLGEFALRPTQAAVLAVFVPLAELQREIDATSRVNTVLIAAPPRAPDEASPVTRAHLESRVRAAVTLDDLGLRVRSARRGLAIESTTGFLADDLASAGTEAARAQGHDVLPVMSYLATTIRIGEREIPYSVVSGLALSDYGPADAVTSGGNVAATDEPVGERGGPDPIWLNEWAAVDAKTSPGAGVRLNYYVWSDADGLQTHSHDFEVAGIVSMNGAGGDPDLIPAYPGLTDETRMSDWDPPFPVDLSRVRDTDEEYWRRYRTAPKAFVSLEVAQRLWGTRYGRVTSLLVLAPDRSDGAADSLAGRLRASVDPLRAGRFSVVPLAAEHATAARGTTDFGAYFLYFTFFLVLSALVLTGLFFRLSVEQRLGELGLLRALGLSPAALRNQFLMEGLGLSVAGAALGMWGAVGWAGVVMAGLRTWWFDAVGTDRLQLHVSWMPLVVGALGGCIAGCVTMGWTLRSLAKLPPRTLLTAVEAPAGDQESDGGSAGRASRLRRLTLVSVLAAGLAGGALAAGSVDTVVGFFVTGAILLGTGVLGFALFARHRAPGTIRPGTGAVARLGVRHVHHRPGRATTAVVLVASATFIIVAVGAFRRDAQPSTSRTSGTGGYQLIGEAVVPVMQNPGTTEGRQSLALPESDVSLRESVFTRLRLRPGDEASCLTLYRPTRPRIVGVPSAILDSDRFRFASTLDAARGNDGGAWSTLNHRFEDGAIPAVGDANSLTYVFHLGLGDTVSMTTEDGRAITFRIVGMLADSVFQSELLIAEDQFIRLFPDAQGYRMLLIESPLDHVDHLTTMLEDRLSDYGLDLQTPTERLASYHRVENTYIATFQALGFLGLLLGTLGIGVLVLRGVLERRKELALLKAVGYRRLHLSVMVMAESAFIATCGAMLGALCALVAAAPAFAQRADVASASRLMALPALVIIVATLSALAAVVAVSRLPVAATIRHD